MKSIIRSIWVIAFCGICEVATATHFPCESEETLIFSCSTAASKTIALCIDERTQLIIYRYGRQKKVEMSFSAKLGSEDGFFYNHYIRPRVDYSRIAFNSGGYDYSIFRSYDAAESHLPKYGVNISKGGEIEVQINCRSRVVDGMSKIIKKLRCNNDSALGCT